MIEDIPTLASFIRLLQQVPYLASKNVYRVADYFLRLDRLKSEQFGQAIADLKIHLDRCEICHCWCEKKRGCPFCNSPKRDVGLVCVVETWHELYAIERTNGFSGVYHVLGGVICPLEGVGPEDLTIANLIKRVKSGSVRELIFATNQTPEGEATASYISVQLKGLSVAITCLSRGVPVGSSLEVMDRLTIYKAICDRRPF